MRKSILLSFLFLCISALAQTLPEKPRNYISDYANVLSEEQEYKLNQKLKNFEGQTSNQIFVYTDLSLNEKNIESFSQELFHHWQIGQKNKNNGVLISIFVNDHKFRIHTGYGLEGALPDLLTRQIQDSDMRPFFKTSDYYTGINNGIDKLIYYSQNEYKPDENNFFADVPIEAWIFLYVFNVLLFFVMYLILKGMKASVAKKTLFVLSLIFVLLPIVGIPALFILIIITGIVFGKKRSGSGSSDYSYNSVYVSDSGWGSDSSSSDSSSDFGGGGGGDSGGGGSSSDW